MQIYQRFTMELNGIGRSLKVSERFAGVALALLFGVLGWLCAMGESAEAAPPPDLYAGTVPVPLGDVSGRLISQVIEATVDESEDGVWVTVDGRFLLESTSPEAGRPLTVSMPTELSGGCVFDPGALSEFEVTANGERRSLSVLQLTVPDASDPITSAYTLALPWPGDDSVATLGVHYRQYLGEEPVIGFRFATAGGSRWTGEIGSSRVTVRLPFVTSVEQVLSVSPPDVSFDGQQIEWYYSDFEPSVDVALDFVKPSVWQQIVEARIRVTEGPESAAAHYELASLYRRVAESGSAAGAGSSVQQMLMAEYEAVLRSPEAVASDVLCEISREMQEYYLERMHRADGAIDTAYLTQAVDAFQQGSEMCGQDQMPPEVSVHIEEGYVYLAHEARRQGRYEAALGHLEAAQVLYGEAADGEDEFVRRIESERRLCFLSWMLDLLRRGEIRAAVEVGERGGISETALADWEALPRVGSVQLSIQTEAGQRRVLMSFTPFPSALDGTTRTVSLESLLRSLDGGGGSRYTTTVSTTDAGSYLVEALIPFGSGGELTESQNALVEALPDWPELAFAKAVLSPVASELTIEESWFERREAYGEIVDARESQAILARERTACADLLQGLDETRNEASEESVESELDRVRREVLVTALDGWERLASESRAVFSMNWISLTGERVERTWTVGAGQELEMHLESQVYDWNAISIAAGVAVLGVVTLVLILFLLARVRR